MLKKSIIVGSVLGFVAGSYVVYRNIQNTKQPKQSVVLVGFGYAGRTFYKNLDKSKYDIKVILGGVPTVTQPKFIDSLKNGTSEQIYLIPKDNNTFLVHDRVESISGNSIRTSNRSLNFDYLVMAIGHETNTFNIQGVDKHCLYFTTHQDLENIKELKSNGHEHPNRPLKIAVVGAGLAGLEVAGYLSGLHDVDVIEYCTNILPSMKSKTQSDIYNLLQSKHRVNFKLGTQLLSVEENDVTKRKIVSTKVGGTLSETVEYDVVIWTAGIQPNSNMKKLFETHKVNPHLKVTTAENVYAIGDCNDTVPKSAQNAKLQGEYLAEVFNSNFVDSKGYIFKSMGIIIRLPDNVYIETKYYSGFAPRFVHDIVQWLNI
jgi:NADH dehydrogenase FAD-containing subunit